MLVSAMPTYAQGEASGHVPDLLPPVIFTDTEIPPLVPLLNSDEIAFSAQTVEYDGEAYIITATGDVQMVREGARLRADQVIWNRRNGTVEARGDVAIRSPQGETTYADSATLIDTLRDGMVENLLIVLENGGRLTARHGNRVDTVSTLENAAYTPYRARGYDGEPREPSWRITAARIVHDPAINRIRYSNARFELFGVTIMALPVFSHPDGSIGGASGFLVPDLRLSRSNGLEIGVPYYLQIGPNRDLAITPRFYTEVLPSLSANYRNLAAEGAFQIGGMITYGTRRDFDPILGFTTSGNEGVRGYIEGNGRFQFTPYWSVSGSGRLTTDDTFLRRYDISRDDRLRSTVAVERVGMNSYFSLSGWVVQDLRLTSDSGQQPLAIPVIDYRMRMNENWLGGTINLQANTLGVVRTEGQDSQRAFVSAGWNLSRITTMGQQVTLTALVRGDAYHSDENIDTLTNFYRGEDGWQFRGISAVAADVDWPFVGKMLGGVQRFTPRIQFVATPSLSNLEVPNEDSRSIELETANVFALNRFPGYDRFEDGVRMTYGGEYALDLPRFSLRTSLAQSYRLNREPTLFPTGTGLASRFSDFVGRTEIRYGRFISLTHRFRLDKDNLELRRNEIDFTIGSRTTFAEIGYLRLNRDITFNVEDLRDREELRSSTRVAIGNYWSIFGSAVVDLTSQEEDPISQSDGFEPVRTRLGFGYEDEGLEFGFTWRRNYDDTGDARRGNTFLLRFALTNLGPLS